jgi:hypothetical protein
MISGVVILTHDGFLGGATLGADLNLVVQLVMGVALIAGARFANKNAIELTAS